MSRHIASGLSVAAVTAIFVTNAAVGSASAPGRQPPVNLTPPSISGTTEVGRLLTAAPGTWGGKGLKYGYQWLSCASTGGGCTAIGGARAPTYSLSSGDVGATIRVVVTASNKNGSAAATSAPTNAIAGAPPPPTSSTFLPPANTALPEIVGSAVVGQTLTATIGAWSGSPTSYSYQWRRCDQTGVNCVPISGANAGTYTLSTSDAGSRDVVNVTATNAGGSTEASSTPTAVIQALTTASPAPTSVRGVLVSMDGLSNLKVGQYPGRLVSTRFVANHTGTATSVRLYLIHTSTPNAYSNGTGGEFRVEVQTDNGGIPSGIVVGTGYTITDPLNGYFRTAQISADLVAGRMYHLVFSNPDPDPINNYVSIDNAYVPSGEPTLDPSGYTVLYRNDTNASWQVRPHDSPIFGLTYADGSSQGFGYYESLIGSPVVIGSATEVIKPSSDLQITDLAVRVRKTVATGPLTISLNGVSVDVPAAQIPTTSTWIKVPLVTTLMSGVSYNLVMSAAGGYTTFQLKKGSVYGFPASTFFTEGADSLLPYADYQVRLWTS